MCCLSLSHPAQSPATCPPEADVGRLQLPALQEQGQQTVCWMLPLERSSTAATHPPARGTPGTQQKPLWQRISYKGF